MQTINLYILTYIFSVLVLFMFYNSLEDSEKKRWWWWEKKKKPSPETMTLTYLYF